MRVKYVFETLEGGGGIGGEAYNYTRIEYKSREINNVIFYAVF